MYDANAEIGLTRILLIAMGLEIGNNNVVVDSETKEQLAFDGKIIKANDDVTKALYISEYDVRLEPVNPKCTKLMERLFGRFLDQEVELGNITEVRTYYFEKKTFDDDPDNSKTRMTMKYPNEDETSTLTWEGNWWYNKILCIVEAILTIDGTFIETDLRPFNIPQTDEEEEVPKTVNIENLAKGNL